VYFCGTVFVCPQSPYSGNDMLFWIFAYFRGHAFCMWQDPSRSAVGRTVHDGILICFQLGLCRYSYQPCIIVIVHKRAEKNLANIQVSNDSVSSRLWKNLLKQKRSLYFFFELSFPSGRFIFGHHLSNFGQKFRTHWNYMQATTKAIYELAPELEEGLLRWNRTGNSISSLN